MNTLNIVLKVVYLSNFLYFLNARTLNQKGFTLSTQNETVRALEVLPDGTLASGFASSVVNLWDVDTSSITQTLYGHDAGVFSLRALRYDRLAGSFDDSTRIWDTTSGEVIQTINDRCLSLSALPSNTLACGTQNGEITIWETNNGSLVQTLVAHTDRVSSLVYLRGSRLASASDDGTIKVWDISTGELVQELTGHNDSVISLALLPFSKLVSGSLDGTVRLWDVNSGSTIRVLDREDSASVQSLVVLSDGTLATSYDDGTILVWNLEDGSKIESLNGHTGEVRALAVLKDGRLVSGSQDGARFKRVGWFSRQIRKIKAEA